MTIQTETGTMVHPAHYSSKQLDHLGLVAGMCDELGIAERIDERIPQDLIKRKVSAGQAVKAMILNGLGFANRSLYLTERFFRDKPVERLIGEGIEAEHLNDDVLGRALDAIYEYGPAKLYPQLALTVVTHLGLPCRFGHMDSTSFHVDGKYNSDEPPEDGVVHITKGYSRDYRPDLNQFVLQLLVERQAGIPLLMQTLNGNNSDKESFRGMVTDYIEQLRGGFGMEYLIADSALYSAENIQAISAIKWITRVPETLGLACDAIDASAPVLMRDTMQSAHQSFETEYEGVRQRWVVIFSPEAYQRARKTGDKQFHKQSTAEHKALDKLRKQAFACEADARKALADFTKKLKVITVHDAEITAVPRFKGKGRPTQGRKPDRIDYHIEAAPASSIQERTRRLQRKSCFILACNELDSAVLSDRDLIAAYKDQQKVERGFRFLKDPMFMASTLFLKSPKRIMALMMVMTLSLLVYAALEHRIRESLKIHNATFPNQKGEQVSNPTARWVFQFFSGIHVLIVNQMQELVLNMNMQQAALLRLLGERYEGIYSGTG